MAEGARHKTISHTYRGKMRHLIQYNSSVVHQKTQNRTQSNLRRKRIKKVTKLQTNNLLEEHSSTASSIEENSLILDRVEESPPPYYLPLITENLFTKGSSKRAKRYLNHFNLTRKCFERISRIDQSKKGRPVAQPRMFKKTLVLDLDETLVHVFSNPQVFETIEVKCRFSQTEFRTFYVKKRPYCDSFLRKMASLYRVIIFTASQKAYADQIIDLLDPKGDLISARYYRDSCTRRNGQMVKDLGLFGVDPRDIVMVDNLALSFGLQPENGVPVVCYWGDDEEERELADLAHFLEFLNRQDDVRVSIQNHFRWEVLQRYYRDTSLLLRHYLCLN